MSSLRSKLIRLAHANPSLRADLLPLLKEAVEAVQTKSQTDAMRELQSIVKRYKKYERNDPDKPPKNSYGYWSPRDGRVRVVTDRYVSQRVVNIGVEIGSKFAEPADYSYPSDVGRNEAMIKRKAVVESLKSDVNKVLNKLKDAEGGFIIDSYGTAYSTIGWSK